MNNVNPFKNMLRNIVINEKPTFYPVKILPNIDYAKSGEKVDNIPLKNRFKKNEWRPLVIDDYVSAYLSLSVTPVEIAQERFEKNFNHCHLKIPISNRSETLDYPTKNNFHIQIRI